MISLVRIDDRLIHGQVAVVWTKYLGVSRIIVANNRVAQNDSQKMALSLAVPSGVKAFFKTIDDTVGILSDSRSEKMKILVIVDSPQDALQLCNKLPNKINSINIGNYGRINNMNGDKKEQLADNLFVTDDDKKYLDLLCQKVDNVYIQSVPTSNKKKL